MSDQGQPLYEFGPFRLDPAKRLLWRDNEPVPLPLKAFETLLVLVRNRQQVVLKDDLMKEIWPNTFVEESNLAQNIFVLRRALGAAAPDHPYIVTISGRGYRFTEEVRVIPRCQPEELQNEGLVLQNSSRSHAIVDANQAVFSDITQSQSLILATPARGATSHRTRVKVLLSAVVLVLAVAATIALRPRVPPPKVIRIRQITHLGTLVHNTRLLTDGPRIYFRAWEGKNRVIRYVSPEGGEVFPVQKAFPDIDIDDLAPSGSEFLAVNLGDIGPVPDQEDPYSSVWRVPMPWGSPQPVGNLRARDTGWSPDGKTIAYSLGSALYLINPDGSNSRKFANLPSAPFHLIWSPDSKRLRFSVADPRSPGFALWQADLSTNTVRSVLPDWPNSARVLPGGWTRDGRYFFYTSVGDGTRNIWAVREKGELLRRISPQPVQLTAGPLTFYLPLPGRDGKTVFAVGEQLRGQLVRYDRATREFVPYAQGISADQVVFSRDGQWMAYVEFPEGVLVRSRVDGSDRRQLTFAPMRAFSPQWSPDGKEIAFQASAQTGAFNKIYVVSIQGGVPLPAVPDRTDRQSYPSWTSDGNAVLFSSSDDLTSKSVLYSVELSSKRVSPFPDTAGLYLAQISPDGRSIVAVEEATLKLMLYDIASHKTRVLAEIGDYPRWSNDGKYIYFSTAYFSGPGRNGGVYRWNTSTNATEIVTKYPEFLLTGAWGVCYGLTPDGDTLMVRDLSTRDLYALDTDLP